MRGLESPRTGRGASIGSFGVVDCRRRRSFCGHRCCELPELPPPPLLACTMSLASRTAAAASCRRRSRRRRRLFGCGWASGVRGAVLPGNGLEQTLVFFFSPFFSREHKRKHMYCLSWLLLAPHRLIPSFGISYWSHIL